ncbi:hypothetical protein MKW94_018270 [Papaver nudicaule]|uniref:Uncharacterized protein n=1 Tax=Papaver nudicaule TaxID=74823 RepID=A0AA42AVV5_PAPNU|nr:hypothetical protein [Papaver nudicaule]
MATLSRRMMQKAASSVIALANRTTPHRDYTTANFTTPLKNSTIDTGSTNQLETLYGKTWYYYPTPANKRPNSDHILISVIESDIERAEEEFHDLKAAEAPGGFPFKIEDNAGDITITLTREYQGEEIKVTVRTPDPSGDSDHEYEEEEKDNPESDPPWVEPDSNVQLDVCVTKKSGSTLELDVTVSGDWMTMNSLAVRNSNAPAEDICYYFSKLDYDLHEAFRTYLKDRGIEPSITCKFLHDYMVNKEHRECAAWLKHLKNFIAN